MAVQVGASPAEEPVKSSTWVTRVFPALGKGVQGSGKANSPRGAACLDWGAQSGLGAGAGASREQQVCAVGGGPFQTAGSPQSPKCSRPMPGGDFREPRASGDVPQQMAEGA